MTIGEYDLRVTPGEIAFAVALRGDRIQATTQVGREAFALMPKTACWTEATWMVRSRLLRVSVEDLARALEDECRRCEQAAT